MGETQNRKFGRVFGERVRTAEAGWRNECDFGKRRCKQKRVERSGSRNNNGTERAKDRVLLADRDRKKICFILGPGSRQCILFIAFRWVLTSFSLLSKITFFNGNMETFEELLLTSRWCWTFSTGIFSLWGGEVGRKEDSKDSEPFQRPANKKFCTHKHLLIGVRHFRKSESSQCFLKPPLLMSTKQKTQKYNTKSSSWRFLISGRGLKRNHLNF